MENGEEHDPADETGATIKRLTMVGRLALLQQDIGRAEQSFTEALQAVDDDHLELAVDLYRRLGQVCKQNGRFQQAQDLERAAEALTEHLEPPLDLSVAGLSRLVAALRTAPQERVMLGSILSRLAMLERLEAGGAAMARAHMEEAVAIALELEPDSSETLVRQSNLAGMRGLDGDLPGAIELADSIKDQVRAEDPRGASILLRSIAQLRARAGEVDGGAADAAEAVELATAAGAAAERAAALSALGMIRSMQGDLAGEAATYREALAVLRAEAGESADGAMASAVNLWRLAKAERSQGDLGQAIEHLTQGVAMLREHTPRGDQLVEMLYSLGEAQAEAGEIGAAAAALRETARITLSPTMRVSCEIRLGDITKELGHYEEAQRMLAEALADAEALGNEGLIAGASMALAGVYRWSGDLDRAQRLYETVVERTADDSPQHAMALSNLAGVHYARGDFDAAALRYRKALELASDLRSVLNITYNLATALHGSGDLAEADAYYAAVVDGITSANRARAEAISGRGQIAAAQGRTEDALGYFRETVATAEQMWAATRGDANRSALFARSEYYYSQLLETLQRLGAPGNAAEALTLAELTRARTLQARLGEPAATAPKASRLEASRLRQKLAAVSRRLLHARTDPESGEATLAGLHRQERELSAALEDLVSPAHPVASAGMLTSAQIQAALHQGTVLLEFQVVNSRVFAWTVTTYAIDLRVLPTDVSELTDLVLRVVGPYHAGLPPEDAAGVWDELREAVLGPLGPLPPETGMLLVSPAGPLNVMPFEPLLDGPTVVYVPSATVGLRPRAPRPNRVAEAEFVGFGNPAFDRTLPEFADLPSLPGAEVEVEEIAGLFGSRGIAFCGDRATEDELRSWARRCRYLHVAAHGLVDLDNPMRSGIVLSSSRMMRLLREPGHDDVLHGYEMIDLDIAAELVVVAACRTGFGSEWHGEGLATVGSALLQGGARWVLVALWPVGDLVSVAFMRVLYEALLDGVAIPEAVKAARAEIRADHDDPYWWAGFALFGLHA
ncbi:CHAT domain-containing protein [Streptomyces durmitorensis]|uniref:CHAT domain-containing protein n=1 Tax=Streptomyces durmitorensis TaxID=319947 RepID=A0ABY4PMW8_9ACTN|nr:CHAT domain-containing protein [Streptomyces durmitorensis]UQT54725.1 CHAT domain-containing protein [Streptomyces durmitorensis]